MGVAVHTSLLEASPPGPPSGGVVLHSVWFQERILRKRCVDYAGLKHTGASKVVVGNTM